MVIYLLDGFLSGGSSTALAANSCIVAWRRHSRQRSMHCRPFRTRPRSSRSGPCPRIDCRSLPVPSAGSPRRPQRHPQASRSGRRWDRQQGRQQGRRWDRRWDRQMSRRRRGRRPAGTPFHHCTNRRLRSESGQRHHHCTGNSFHWNRPGQPASSCGPSRIPNGPNRPIHRRQHPRRNRNQRPHHRRARKPLPALAHSCQSPGTRPGSTTACCCGPLWCATSGIAGERASLTRRRGAGREERGEKREERDRRHVHPEHCTSPAAQFPLGVHGVFCENTVGAAASTSAASLIIIVLHRRRLDVSARLLAEIRYNQYMNGYYTIRRRRDGGVKKSVPDNKSAANPRNPRKERQTAGTRDVPRPIAQTIHALSSHTLTYGFQSFYSSFVSAVQRKAWLG